MNVAVIGTGNVGRALGRGWASAGHDVTWGSRHPERINDLSPVVSLSDAIGNAPVIVLAVPFAGLTETVAALGDLSGRVVVDATNPLGSQAAEGAASGAEYVATLAPGAQVVKGFNTMGYETMADPAIEGRPAACLLCGNDAGSKEIVTGLARDLGFDPVDAGDLEAARHLEALAGVWVHLAFRAGLGRDFAFGVLRRGSGTSSINGVGG
ncbi:MAG TPA: NAD(P)-binding domain-containing protein [Actinomycetota bacterium]|nr:NAD(P)-binding domain-containing protein [Actinomycetota bacterium]